MKTEFNAKVLSFHGDHRRTRMTFREVAETVRDLRAPAMLVDVIPEDEIDAWWNDPGFPPIGGHEHHKGLMSSGLKLTMGQLQRIDGDGLMQGIADYFAFAATINGPMKQTRFVRFFERELGASPMKFGPCSELMLATKREYPPYDAAPHSFAPHCDSLDFGRDPRWPMKHNGEQLGAFVLIQRASNQAGFVLWDLRAGSRADLDGWANEYAETSSIAAAKSARSIAVNPTNGQMVVFNSRYLHGIERCDSTRYTIGTFLIEHGGGWRLFD
ncbi:hypothetical protein [Pendulispora albinea]|uniref:Prolyl 4-hydroxylase alpha subunit Fe(2+) 2OG dioxygenase domain-containing protein n=1 Tax=Pendulispora albinea TaxID=2741071 RepID=A0ABZ2M6C2_9BACT